MRLTIELSPVVVVREMEEPIYVTERTDDALRGLRRTGRECHLCEEGNFLKDDSELICENCQYTPTTDEPSPSSTSPWSRFREARERAAENDNRRYCVGGVPDAYWTEPGEDAGEYEYSPTEGFTAPR